MRREGILNPELISVITEIGHTEFLVIADAGLPIPKDVRCIDLSLIKGVPSFEQALCCVADELVIESYIVAEELCQHGKVGSIVQDCLGSLPSEKISHEEFKQRIKNAKAIIRTGEISSYANVILVAGVNF